MNEVSQRNVVIQGADKDYDVLEAEKTVKEFCAFIREAISHFEENKRLQEDAEAREMDLMHCIELTEDVTPEEKSQLYEKLTTTLQTRRACKIENQILKPLYDLVVDKQMLNRLAQVQGNIGTVKNTVSNRQYACRTDVLDDFRLEPPADENSSEVDIEIAADVISTTDSPTSTDAASLIETTIQTETVSPTESEKQATKGRKKAKTGK